MQICNAEISSTLGRYSTEKKQLDTRLCYFLQNVLFDIAETPPGDPRCERDHSFFLFRLV